MNDGAEGNGDENLSRASSLPDKVSRVVIVIIVFAWYPGIQNHLFSAGKGSNKPQRPFALDSIQVRFLGLLRE